MISIEQAVVKKILWSRKGIQCLEVFLNEKNEKAINYPDLTGTASPGNRVILNTTAMELGLGSGGYHFVMSNCEIKSVPLKPDGHIMKLRYTPMQLKVKAYEEVLSNSNPTAAGDKYLGLKKIPVVIGELHSMLAPFVLALKELIPSCRIAYIMTDNAALPITLSNTVHRLKNDRYLEGTVTCGHAFGADIETVNFYSALMAAREELSAEVIITTPGPGVVGTSTRYGCSGMEQGEHIDRVDRMQGIPVFIPRISFHDSRGRHRGLSHHTLTALGEISYKSAYIPLPSFDREKMLFVYRQLKNSNVLEKHRVMIIKEKAKLIIFQKNDYDFSTMGRSIREDPAFFASVLSAAYFIKRLLKAVRI
jgi:hypothetical protein